jgi:hypothetical protein
MIKQRRDALAALDRCAMNQIVNPRLSYMESLREEALYAPRPL